MLTLDGLPEKLKVADLVRNEPTLERITVGGTLTVTVLKQLNSRGKLLNGRALGALQSLELGFVAGLLQLAKLCSLP